jgi:hypothetical protein
MLPAFCKSLELGKRVGLGSLYIRKQELAQLKMEH